MPNFALKFKQCIGADYLAGGLVEVQTARKLLVMQTLSWPFELQLVHKPDNSKTPKL